MSHVMKAVLAMTFVMGGEIVLAADPAYSINLEQLDA